MVSLGKLTKINNLRKVWSDEARDFTPWLAKEENLEILGTEVGLDIELIETEAKTGSFSTDILAKDSFTEDKIIIENQLEQTDHNHLGKLMVYAAGHDANTIIWIVKEVREEHRQAIDWLNEHTDTEVNIFLIKIELWQIDDSDMAPKFNIISSPNNWSKTLKKPQSNERTDLELKQLEYWTKFSDYIGEFSEYFKPKNYQKPHQWYDLPLRGKYAYISLTINSNTKTITSQIYIENNKELFDYLHGFKDKIEEDFGQKLIWDIKDNRNACKISVHHDLDPMDDKNWDNSFKLHLDDAEKLLTVFKPFVDEYVDND